MAWIQSEHKNYFSTTQYFMNHPGLGSYYTSDVSLVIFIGKLQYFLFGIGLTILTGFHVVTGIIYSSTIDLTLISLLQIRLYLSIPTILIFMRIIKIICLSNIYQWNIN